MTHEKRWDEKRWAGINVRRAQMRWSVECEVWSVKNAVWSAKCGVKSEVWSVECEVWSVECEVWSLKSAVWGEVWSAKSAMWSVKCGVWSVKCGVWSVKCGVWSVKSAVRSVKWSFKCNIWNRTPLSQNARTQGPSCAIFPLHLCTVMRLPRQSEAKSYEVLHLSRKIILANLEIWCSNMQPLSGNQRPDLLTSLMNMSRALRLPRKMHLYRSSSNVPLLPTLWKLLQNPHVSLPFDKVRNPLHLPRKSTSEPSKVVRACRAFNILT